jgi:hypothetical protein
MQGRIIGGPSTRLRTGFDGGAEAGLGGEALAERLGLQRDIAYGERLRVGLGEGGIGAAVEVHGRFGNADGLGRRPGVAVRRETGEEERLPLGVEADVAAPAALVEAAVGGGDTDFPSLPALAAIGISARPALGGG